MYVHSEYKKAESLNLLLTRLDEIYSGDSVHLNKQSNSKLMEVLDFLFEMSSNPVKNTFMKSGLMESLGARLEMPDLTATAFTGEHWQMSTFEDDVEEIEEMDGECSLTELSLLESIEAETTAVDLTHLNTYQVTSKKYWMHSLESTSDSYASNNSLQAFFNQTLNSSNPQSTHYITSLAYIRECILLLSLKPSLLSSTTPPARIGLQNISSEATQNINQAILILHSSIQIITKFCNENRKCLKATVRDLCAGLEVLLGKWNGIILDFEDEYVRGEVEYVSVLAFVNKIDGLLVGLSEVTRLVVSIGGAIINATYTFLDNTLKTCDSELTRIALDLFIRSIQSYFTVIEQLLVHGDSSSDESDLQTNAPLFSKPLHSSVLDCIKLVNICSNLKLHIKSSPFLLHLTIALDINTIQTTPLHIIINRFFEDSVSTHIAYIERILHTHTLATAQLNLGGIIESLHGLFLMQEGRTMNAFSQEICIAVNGGDMRSSVLNRVLTSIVREETFVSSIMTDLVTVNVSRNDTKNLSEIQSLKRITLDHAIITPEHIQSYNSIFFLLISLKHALVLLNTKCYPSKHTEAQNRVHIALRQELVQFVTHLQSYFMMNVVQVECDKLATNMRGSTRFSGLKEMHASFIGRVSDRCFLNTKSIMVGIEGILEVVCELSEVCESFEAVQAQPKALEARTTSASSRPSKTRLDPRSKTIQKLHSAFKEKKRFLADLLYSLPEFEWLQ